MRRLGAEPGVRRPRRGGARGGRAPEQERGVARGEDAPGDQVVEDDVRPARRLSRRSRPFEGRAVRGGRRGRRCRRRRLVGLAWATRVYRRPLGAVAPAARGCAPRGTGVLLDAKAWTCGDRRGRGVEARGRGVEHLGDALAVLMRGREPEETPQRVVVERVEGGVPAPDNARSCVAARAARRGRASTRRRRRAARLRAPHGAAFVRRSRPNGPVVRVGNASPRAAGRARRRGAPRVWNRSTCLLRPKGHGGHVSCRCRAPKRSAGGWLRGHSRSRWTTQRRLLRCGHSRSIVAPAASKLGGWSVKRIRPHASAPQCGGAAHHHACLHPVVRLHLDTLRLRHATVGRYGPQRSPRRRRARIFYWTDDQVSAAAFSLGLPVAVSPAP